MTKRVLVECLCLQRPSLSKEKVDPPPKLSCNIHVCFLPLPNLLCNLSKERVFVRSTSVSVGDFVESLCRGLSSRCTGLCFVVLVEGLCRESLQRSLESLSLRVIVEIFICFCEKL